LITPVEIAGTAVEAHARTLVWPRPPRPGRRRAGARIARRRGAHHDVGELRHAVQVGARGDVELALLALDAPGRHLEVLAPQRVLDVLHRQP
jgi:hypothetical protein